MVPKESGRPLHRRLVVRGVLEERGCSENCRCCIRPNHSRDEKSKLFSRVLFSYGVSSSASFLPMPTLPIESARRGSFPRYKHICARYLHYRDYTQARNFFGVTRWHNRRRGCRCDRRRGGGV